MSKHETKQEFRERLKPFLFLKLLYFFGVLKATPRQHVLGGKYRYDFKLRLVHPVTWVILLVDLILHGANKKTFKDWKKNVEII